jgi:hypothetical protein
MIDIYNLDKFYLDDFIKDLFIGFYQSLFNQNRGEFRYDPDKAVSKLNIADQFHVDDLTPEMKPSIYIRRRSFSYMNLSIDQRGGSDMMTGATAYSDMISGVLEVVALSRNGLEASRLAGIIFLLTNQFKTELRKRTGMFKIDVKTLGEEQPIDVRSGFRIVEVPVVIQVMFQYTWAMNTMGLQTLADIDVGRSSDLTGNSGFGGNSNNTDLVGIPNTGCNDGTGVNVDDTDGNGDGQVKICIPLTSDSPKRPEGE